MNSGKPNVRFNRETMVDRQLVRRGITDKNVLHAMETVPREAFMPQEMAAMAYEDMPAQIGEGQTISQPYIVAKMAALAELKATDKVLEIGTGSGYGAAVLSRIVAQVFTIERNPVLAASAKNAIGKLGYKNIHFVEGDGTLGLESSAPFDAIIVTAGAPEVPQSLLDQLTDDGRLVIPAGAADGQNMLLIRRTGALNEKTEHGAVRFVPLIGRYGWENEQQVKTSVDTSSQSYLRAAKPEKGFTAGEIIQQRASKLPGPQNDSFGSHFRHLADAKIVLLGESSHGTAEFYEARAAITRYLVQEHGFNIIALEADWPDVAVLDGYIRDREVPSIGQPAFSRFPQWMWRNEEFRELLPWLRHHNASKDPADKAGIYGLDLYSMQASVHAIVTYLEKHDPALAEVAKERYSCFEPWVKNPAAYGNSVLNADFSGCEKQAIEMLMKLMDEHQVFGEGYEDGYLDLVSNASTLTSAEQYYRAIYYSSEQSWNLRDTHMFDTLKTVLKSRGSKARAIVWAHNSHVGDARATEMGKYRGQLTLGQLCREKFQSEARLVGFGTATGTVAAASDWGGKMEIKNVQSPLPHSIEKLWDETGLSRATLNMNSLSESERIMLEKNYLERAIGVIYRPQSERSSHYFECVLAQQFDDYIWFKETRAVTPLPSVHDIANAETYPFGL